MEHLAAAVRQLKSRHALASAVPRCSITSLEQKSVEAVQAQPVAVTPRAPGTAAPSADSAIPHKFIRLFGLFPLLAVFPDGALAEHGAFQIAMLVETEQGMVAGTTETAVAGTAFLVAVGWTDRF